MTEPTEIERVALPLDWQVPGEDAPGHEDAILTAPGIGGSYDISRETSGGYMLWWAADPFTFQEDFATVADAQAAAEADWQKSIRASMNPEVERLREQVGALREAIGEAFDLLGGREQWLIEQLAAEWGWKESDLRARLDHDIQVIEAELTMFRARSRTLKGGR